MWEVVRFLAAIKGGFGLVPKIQLVGGFALGRSMVA
jgi:hypothetical protein